MKKVFIAHGFEGSPNGGWRPWLMGELSKRGIYACSLAMPSPHDPYPQEWVAEIARHVALNPDDEIFLVGHSLGAATVMRYLESAAKPIAGAVLVSGPCKGGRNPKTERFFTTPLDFPAIKSKARAITVIHGEDDHVVPFEHAQIIATGLDAGLIAVPNGKHLNGSAGWLTLPQALEALAKMMQP